MNYKKLITLFAINLVLLGKPCFAQRQVQDYTYQYEKYRTNYDEYTVAKNEFLKQKTLTSQKDALDKTKVIITQRAQTLRVYLMALKYSLNTTAGIANEDKIRLSANLDEEIGWLQNHIDDITGMNNPTLTDLFEISSRLERKKNQYIILSHETVAHILIGRLRQLNQEYSATNSVLQPLVDKYKNSFIKNWYDQSVDMTFRCDQSITNALAIAEELKKANDENAASKSLVSIKNELGNGKQLLKDGVGYQQEILKELNKILPKASGKNASASGGNQ